MKINYLELSRYHLFVVTLYVVLCPLIFILTPLRPSFSLTSNDLQLTVALFLGILASLYILNPLLRFGRITFIPLKPAKLLWVLFYSTVLIALPEELIFRGVFQSLLQNNIATTPFVIILSALIFGTAHLLNRAPSLNPRFYNWNLAIASFIVGIFLGIAFALTQSLAVPIILHSMTLLFLKIFVREGIA
jgi:membrane protease YdiL (CAAX protease family)